MEDQNDFLLWCRECGNSIPCEFDDLEKLQQDGYPTCCGEVMTMYTEAYRDRGEQPEAVQCRAHEQRALVTSSDSESRCHLRSRP